MWPKNWRDDLWAALDQPWDLVIIGGGIVGAGILREAARLNLRALLVDQRDFAWGTSSRSSKLVHGGLRYLKNGDLRLTWESVRERERLLRDGRGLVEPIGFLLANYRNDKSSRAMYGAGLMLYDLMALQWSHQYYGPDRLKALVPSIACDGLKGAYHYGDAQTDDARLVIRVIQEAMARCDTVRSINYVAARELICNGDRVVGVRLHDREEDRTADVRARVVVNATGAWADSLRKQRGSPARIRPLRGSHLLFPHRRLPVAHSVNFNHPLDHRPVFVLPWEGVTMVGTTDVDYTESLDDEPAISPEEVAYLMAAVDYAFPSVEMALDDVIATYAGVRPVINTGKADPSKESREHAVWYESGLLTVTGGKLTTFRVMAQDAIKAIPHDVLALSSLSDRGSLLEPVPDALDSLDPVIGQRLSGRNGSAAQALVEAALPGELTRVPGTNMLWAELRWAARSEAVLHLDDLLLRRVRLGLILPQGAASLLPKIRAICQPELGWSDARWEQEATTYCALWQRHYSLPPKDTVPDWKHILADARA